MTFREKAKTLEKLAELGVEDRVLDQTLTKLIDYAVEKHREDLKEINAKLHTLEKEFGMPSEQFYEKFHRGELGDEESFFRWDALIEMYRRVDQRLSLLLSGHSV